MSSMFARSFSNPVQLSDYFILTFPCSSLLSRLRLFPSPGKCWLANPLPQLGGKSPVIVDASADPALAARRVLLGRFVNAGQTCVSPDYVLVAKDRCVGWFEHPTRPPPCPLKARSAIAELPVFRAGPESTSPLRASAPRERSER